MSFDRFLEPVSAEELCGPDLLATDDDAYLDYYYGALDRLPEKFFDPASGRPVDLSAIRIDAERAAVEALMQRSRDLRPLAILAQFAALTGRLPLLADTVGLMAGLLERYPDALHPRAEADNAERMTAIGLLDVQPTLALPLEFAVILTDRRLQRISFRRYAVSAGLRSPMGGETPEDAAGLVAALGAEANKDEVEASHAALAALRDGLRRIADACLLAERHPFRPRFERTEPLVEQILALIAEARPDLGGAAGSADADAAAAPDDAAAEGDVGAAPAMTPAAPASPVTSHAAARAALAAVEGYFAAKEPSSPALILVRQAHQLVGQPLIRALELLMPEAASRARIDLAAESGLLLGADRIRDLSQVPEAPETPEAPDTDETPPPEFSAATRAEASGLMSAVEGFFRAAEPSSPIAMLMFKARGYLNRDFAALLAELIPPKS